MKTLYEMSNEELLDELLVYIVMQEPKDMDHEMFYNFKREILWRIEGKSMNIMDLCEAYAKMSNEPMHPMTVKEQYDAGWISKYELFDAFLRHEGIIGYTTKVINAFRICYELDQNKPGNPKGDPGLL